METVFGLSVLFSVITCLDVGQFPSIVLRKSFILSFFFLLCILGHSLTSTKLSVEVFVSVLLLLIFQPFFVL